MRSFLVLLAALASASGQQNSMNPVVSQIVGGVSSDRIIATLKRLESFETRNTLSSQTDPNHGIGAARNWIASELRSYSPRLRVSLDTHRVKKQGRITSDVEVSNIVAVLPGTINKDRQVLVTAHYDTLALSRPLTDEERRAGEEIKAADPNALAPGVNDDGSGTAAVMELARVMSRQEFENTVVFVLFAAEEQGLIGSALFARKANGEKRQIEAVLNNDIIGSETSGDGMSDSVSVRVFSEEPADSPSRQLARYIKEIGERYVPAMRVELVFRADRFGRGGDHTPFNQEGYPAVRFSSAEENYANQHTKTDTLANMSPAYTTRVAKINGAVAATLALAPKAPVVTEPIQNGPRKGQPAPMIGRGKSRYDALLRWKSESPESDLAGYLVLMRSTIEPFWQKSVFVGKDASQFLLPNVSIDEFVFAVQALDNDGNPSLPSVYGLTAREKAKIETY
jgi:hypothetical protein